jgi:Beta-mannanase
MNGTWFEWSVAGNPAGYVACWQRVVNAIRATAPQARFAWTINAHSPDPMPAYPGDSYVDVIGIDAYDHYPKSTTDAEFTTQAAAVSGIGWTLDRAVAHGKKLAVPEWGVEQPADANHGGDNPFFITKMQNFFRANAANIYIETYFDAAQSRIFAPPVQNPNAGIAYVAGLSSTPTPTPSPSPTPSPQLSPTPTVSPTPGPTSRTCAPFPAMPDTACTGVPPNTPLHSCALELRAAGSYDSCLFSGSVQVMAKGVTITRSRVGGRVGDGGTGLLYDSTWALRLVDVEIDGGTTIDPYGQAAIGQDGWSCLRCNVHHTGRGANFGTNVTIEDSYFHDFKGVSGAHMSAAGNNGGQHSRVIHNTLDCVSVTGQGACSGALVMYGDFAPIDDIILQNNLFASPGSYCLYAGSTGTASGKPYPHGTNIRVVDNLWSKKYSPVCGQYGPVTAWEWNAGNAWSNNAYQDGTPITV